ncbi:MAG: MFS transporter [Henriciella sp.]
MAEAQVQTIATSNDGFGSKGYRAYVLSALTIAYIFNFIDRVMIGILAEPIISHFGLTDMQFGLLSGLAFALFYTLLGIPIARLSERFDRTLIIGCAILLWSGMTVLCGLATSFWMLFIFRLGVGVGEAGLTPPANSLISDYFKPTSRAQALAIYAMGITVGTFFANLFVGLTGAQVSWQQTFIIIGIAGIPVGILMILSVKEVPRGYSDPPGATRQESPGIFDTLKELGTKPTFWWTTAGATLASFVGYGIGNFIISFLVRNHSITVPEAALTYMAPLSIVAAFGTWLCGFLVQRLANGRPVSSLWMTALSLTIASLAYIAAFNVGSVAMILPLLVLANLFHYWYLGPMYSVTSSVVSARSRATAVAILLFVVNLIGYGLGPIFVGWLSDIMATSALASTPELSLSICKADVSALVQAQIDTCRTAIGTGLKNSISVTMLIFIVAAGCFLMAMRTYHKDTAVETGPEVTAAT